MHPLDGARLKFSRAVEHLNALDNAVQRFNNSDPCIMLPELNDQTGEIILKVKILKTPPLEWAIVIGDIAHELRSLLDHMTWQLALTQTTSPYGKTEFPIFTDSSLYSKNGLKSIRDLSVSQKAFIEGLQPYHAGNDILSQPLWLLHELNNTDKHRILPIATAALVYGKDPMSQVRVFFPYDGKDNTVSHVSFGITMHAQLGVPMEDGTKFATLKMLKWISPYNEMQVHAEASSCIIFGNGIKANSGRRIDRTLSAIFPKIQTILSDCAKQFF